MEYQEMVKTFGACTTMPEFAALLKSIDEDNSIPNAFNTFDGEGYLTDEMSPKIQYASYVAAGLLIKNSGQPDFTAHTELERDYGYRVTAGEKDSFGWLTGIVHIGKGMLVYG